jgi:hypothetical protein
MASQRKSVRVRQVAYMRDRYGSGPVRVLRIRYRDGRRTWGVSYPGGLALFGTDRQAANGYVRALAGGV